MHDPSQIKRAATHEELAPLIDFCKTGRLFDVQRWVEAGNPVNPPAPIPKRARKWTPLQFAIDRGFHSLVELLLMAGADVHDNYRYSPLMHAIRKKRLDLVELLVAHGADPAQVNMEEVFYSWEPAFMEYFIEHGADVETGNPLACVLSDCVRTALRVFKKYRYQIDSFQEQANIALRYHCKGGNEKWVLLMLWAGADPYAPGNVNFYEDPDPEYEGTSAIEYAAFYGHFDLLTLRQMKLDPAHPHTRSVMHYAYKAPAGIKLLGQLLNKGMKPNDLENGGCSAIREMAVHMDWDLRFHRPFSERADKKYRNQDTHEARARLEVIDLLASHGARWLPVDLDEIRYARRSFISMQPHYTVDFIQSMSKHKACTRTTATELLRTPSIKEVIARHSTRITELVASLPATLP